MSEGFAAALSRLDDYVRGQGDDESQGEYEESLFQRALANDAPELTFRAGLCATLRSMNARGTLDMWLSRSQFEKLLSSELRTALLVFDSENPTGVEIPPDAELVITKVKLDLTDVQSLEVEVLNDDGSTLKRMPDIAFDAAENAIYICCEAELARKASASKRMTRLWATGPSGRWLLAELPAG
jgi:hypothetical protein